MGEICPLGCTTKILKYNNPDKSLSNPYYEGQKLGDMGIQNNWNRTKR